MLNCNNITERTLIYEKHIKLVFTPTVMKNRKRVDIVLTEHNRGYFNKFSTLISDSL